MALALLQSSDFTESFERGQTVDLSQGFYVCGQTPPATTLERIALFRDQRTRKNKAESLGCPLYRNAHPAVTQVQEVGPAYCGPLVAVEGGMMCRNEAHQLVVGVGRQRVTVIFVLDDYSVD